MDGISFVSSDGRFGMIYDTPWGEDGTCGCSGTAAANGAQLSFGMYTAHRQQSRIPRHAS